MLLFASPGLAIASLLGLLALALLMFRNLERR